MAQQDTKLKELEKRISSKTKVKEIVKITLSRGIYYLDGMIITPSAYQEMLHVPGTQVILVRRTDAQIARD